VFFLVCALGNEIIKMGGTFERVTIGNIRHRSYSAFRLGRKDA
jgi:hypothetical protein